MAERIDWLQPCKCTHPRNVHERGDQPVTGRCLICPDWNCPGFDAR